jgi:5-methyltetrahydrofolate--homocysteine methyltransferase
MSRFLKALHSGRVLLMDGAMGTELQRAGIAEGECYEIWNLTHPEIVRDIHRAYLAAGARCILTNTFQANPFALARFALQDRLEQINESAVAIARSACGPDQFVLASIGPIAHRVADEDFDGNAYLAAVHRVVQSLAGVDALLFETWTDCTRCWPGHTVPVNSPPDLPVLGSFTYWGGMSMLGRYHLIQEGIEPDRLAGSIVQHFPTLAALGVNCGKDIGMDEIIAIIGRYRQVTDLPLFARPNAGTPVKKGKQWVYPLTPHEMARRLPELLEAGVCMVGGCCGTTPEHIRAMRPIVDAWNARMDRHQARKRR